jgi:translation elongation factor EF-Tu-like GTPase
MNLLMIGLEPAYEKVGRITHFFPKAGVAVLELSATVNNGDKIVIRGSTTNVEQTIDSMEIEHEQITTAGAGQSIGLKVSGRVRENDIVYKIRAP